MRFRFILPFVFAWAAAAQVSTTGITSILPANGATGVPLNARIIVALAYPASYLTQNPVKLTSAGVPVNGTIQVPDFSTPAFPPPPGAFGWYVFTPASSLAPMTTYTVEVDLPAVGDIPNRPPFITTFTTGTTSDTTPLQLISSIPAPGQNGVNTAGQLTLHFNKPLNPYSFSQESIDIRDLSSTYLTYIQPQIQLDGSSLVSSLSAPDSVGLTSGHAFEIEFDPSQITDWLGNLLALPAPIPFTTIPNPETAGPILVGTAPANNDVGVSTNSSIVLVFDKPLAELSFNAGITVSAGGAVGFKLDNSLSGGRVLIIEPTSLLPANTQVNVSVTGLLDAYGAPQTTPITFGFQTGASAETRPLQMVPQTVVTWPRNAPVLVTFNRPIDPLVLALGGTGVSPAVLYNFAPVPYQVSADHLTVTISAGAPLPAGVYVGSINIPFDREQGKIAAFTVNFTVTGNVDTTPPQVTAVNPPDGTSGAPPSSLVQAAFSKQVFVPAGTGGFQLLQGGNPVAGTFALNGTQGTFTPVAPLAASAPYQIRISGLTDLSGNAMPDFSSSFTTATASTLPPFQVTSISPAANATGVDPATSIVVTFNRPVDQVTVLSPNNAVFLESLNYPSPSYLPGTFQFSGATATFTPGSPLLPGTYRVLTAGLTDLAGSFLATSTSSFQVTATAPQTTGPAVVSVWPGDGQTVLYQAPWVVFTFSKPVDPSTVNNANFRAYTSNGNISVTVTPLAGGTQVSMQFSGADPGSLVTLYVNPGVTDLAGNSLVAPFRTTVRMSEPPAANTTYVVAQRPNYASAPPFPNTAISLTFSAPVDRASVQQGLLVTANGALVSGTVAWSPDSTALSFSPSAPFPYSASIGITLIYPARDAAGNAITYNDFSVKIADPPPSPPSSLTVTRVSTSYFSGPAPLDTVIEVEFSGDVPPGFASPATGTIGPVNPLGGAPNGPAIACSATLIGTRVIRFQPAARLSANTYYTFTFDSGTGVKTASGFILTGTSLTPSNPALIAYGPNDTSATNVPSTRLLAAAVSRRPPARLVRGSVPLNTRIVVAFSTAVSELAMPGGINLQIHGVDVPASFVWSSGDRAITVTPLAFLLPETAYQVAVTGFADYAGHAIPAQTWTFHTSATVDLTTPAILRIGPTGNTVSANAPISVTFSKPVAADWILGFHVEDDGVIDSVGGGPALSGAIHFSADQQTLFFNADQPFPAGHTILITVPDVDDFAGNLLSLPPGYTSSTGSFAVAFTPAGAPVVAAATPDNGSTGIPLNVQMQVQFDQPVLASSLSGVLLYANGSPVAASARVEADGRTVTALPAMLPSAGTTYTLTVSGVTNTAGVAMAGSYQTAFTTGSTLDDTPPTLLSFPVSGQLEVPTGATMKWRSNKPLNKLTVNANTAGVFRQPFNLPIDANVSLQDSGYTILITPALPLSTDAQYYLVLNGVTDLAGNSINITTGFSTSDGLPVAPVSLLAIDPQNGSVNVPPGTTVQALFSQGVDLTLGNASMVLQGTSGSVPGTLSVNGPLLTFTPARNLADGVYQVQLSGMADISGNPVATVSSSFTVSAASVNLNQPYLVSSNPAYGTVGVPVSSSITLNFNKPMNAVSAAQMVLYGNGPIPASVVTNGSTVTFTPSAKLPGAATIGISGSITDLNGLPAEFVMQFTTGANPDTTAPTLTYAYPAEGALVPADGTNVVLRFSEPVVPNPGTSPIQVYVGATRLSPAQFSEGEDGETFTSNLSLAPSSQITLSVTSDLVDFAGNPFQAFSIHFNTESDAQSRGPSILSVSPANGAVNVDVNSPFQIVFGQAMNAPSVQAAFDATIGGVLAATSMSQDSSIQTFTFQPAAPWLAGSSVETFLGSAAFDMTGAQIAPQNWQFSTLGASSSMAQAVAFSASANAIDVRFAGAVPNSVNNAYLRLGNVLIPSHREITSVDQVRFTPEATLAPGAQYKLVLDANHEIAFAVELQSPEPPEVTSVVADVRGIHVRFSRPVNPLTLRSRTRIAGPDGKAIAFTTLTTLGSEEILLVPAESARSMTIAIDGMESRDGIRMPARTFPVTAP